MVGLSMMYTKEKWYWRNGVGSFGKDRFSVLDFVARKHLPDEKTKNLNEIKKQAVQKAGRRAIQYKAWEGSMPACGQKASGTGWLTLGACGGTEVREAQRARNAGMLGHCDDFQRLLLWKSAHGHDYIRN